MIIDIKEFVKECLVNPITRQLTIEYTRIKYYEFQAGALWKLSEKRPLTQAEEVRRQWYRDNPAHE